MGARSGTPHHPKSNQGLYLFFIFECNKITLVKLYTRHPLRSPTIRWNVTSTRRRLPSSELESALLGVTRTSRRHVSDGLKPSTQRGRHIVDGCEETVKSIGRKTGHDTLSRPWGPDQDQNGQSVTVKDVLFTFVSVLHSRLTHGCGSKLTPNSPQPRFHQDGWEIKRPGIVRQLCSPSGDTDPLSVPGRWGGDGDP